MLGSTFSFGRRGGGKESQESGILCGVVIPDFVVFGFLGSKWGVADRRTGPEQTVRCGVVGPPTCRARVVRCGRSALPDQTQTVPARRQAVTAPPVVIS